MNKIMKKIVCAGICSILSPLSAQADLITFSFTGRLTVVDPSGNVIPGTDPSLSGGYQTPIAADLTYDTALGLGSTGLTFEFSYLDNPVSIHDISLNFLEGTTSIEGMMLADWAGSINNQIQIMWDATGLFNAIDLGLNVGDRISGTNMYRDTDGDGYGDLWIADVNSATPLSDTFAYYGFNQGPAPLATATGTQGIAGGPFDGIAVHLDIGSGDSLYVTSIEPSPVPVPAAVWLFGSGLLGITGLARRKSIS